MTVSDRYFCYNEPEMRNSFGILRRKQAVDRSGIRGVVKSVCRAKKTKKNPQKQTFLRSFGAGKRT